MTVTTTRRMIGAEILKLRKKRSTIAWTLFLGAGAIVVYYLYAALDHASDPRHHAPAGGVAGFTHGIQGLAIFLGPLAAAMIGAEAGAGDHASGVFRDLVATGRSRLALFLVRIPAAVVVTITFVMLGFTSPSWPRSRSPGVVRLRPRARSSRAPGGCCWRTW